MLAAGVTPGALAGAQWRQVAHGWHVPTGVPLTPAQRLVQAAAVLPEGCLSGWAAAYVLGADALDGRDPFTGARQTVRVVLPPEASHRSVPGVRCVRAELDASAVLSVDGLTVTTGLRTAQDLAREAPDLAEAVVALDALVQATVVDLRRLQVGLAGLERGRGVRQARAAGELCRPGVRSTWETRLRLFVVEAGLPEPEVNIPVFDLSGRFLGTPDLLDLEAGLAIEFDGAGHRDREQHRQDNVREEGLEHGGLVVSRVDSRDLTQHRDQLARRLRAARAHALRNPRPVGWTIVPPPGWLGLPA